MENFRTLRRNLELSGIKSNGSNPLNWRILLGFSVFALSIVSTILFNVFMINSLTMEYLESICIASALIEISICMAALFLQQKKLFEILALTEKMIYQRSKYPISNTIYKNTDRRVEKICTVFLVVMVKVIPQLMVWPKFVASLFKYYATDLGEEAFELPLPSWLPFNWNCPFGYLIAIILQWIAVTFVQFTVMILTAVGITLYPFGIALIEDNESILQMIDRDAKVKATRLQIYQKFTEFIDLHSNAKQITSQSSELLQPANLVVFMRSLLTLCCVMLLIQMELLSNHNENSIAPFPLVFDACDTSLVVFVICEFGHRLNSSFSEINDKIERFDWYRFPHELQRILPMIMIIAQKPVYLECFGSISCSRATFKNVCSKALSYFMVLRHFFK